MKTTVFAILAAALALAFAAPATGPAIAQDKQMNMMGSAEPSQIPRVPPVAGYAEGERIYFIHTEVSDPKIGNIMTEMMNSPVPVVPALAAAPKEMLANVYVFTNGVQPDGPRGPLDYQPDIFDRPVGSENYSPLREILLTTWKDGAEPRVLTSVAEVQAAIEAGDVTIERSGVIASMPLLTWPGGQR